MGTAVAQWLIRNVAGSIQQSDPSLVDGYGFGSFIPGLEIHHILTLYRRRWPTYEHISRTLLTSLVKGDQCRQRHIRHAFTQR